MQEDRERRTYTTAGQVIAFARQGVTMGTIARALVIPVQQVTRICERALVTGELLRMPPAEETNRRDAMTTEVIHLRQKVIDQSALIAQLTVERVRKSVQFGGVAGLTRTEARVVAVLADGDGQATKAEIMNRVYFDYLEQDVPDPKIIDVLICKVRKKLEPHGVKIETLWGVGWKMSTASIAALHKLAREHDEVPSPSLQPTLEEVTAV